MSNRYVDVVITRQTKAVSQAAFGLSLVLSTDKNADYKEYTDLTGVSTDFGAESETYKLASAIFGQTPRPEKIAIYGLIYDSAINTPSELVVALNELVDEHNEFFYLHSTEQTDDVIEALSVWADAQEKLYFASTANKTLHETLNSQNTILLVTETPGAYPAAAWVGVCSPQEIGSYTWTFKTLNGIAPDGYDETTLGQIEEGASAYIREGGVNITSKGITTTGEYIDIIQGQYFIKSRMAEAVFGLLARMPKVPFTDAGINMTVAEVENVLKRAAIQGVIATDNDGNPLYTITAPRASEVSANDRANRLLPNVQWEATVAGAVENVEIGGVLQV
jgi:hypothetical protein